MILLNNTSYRFPKHHVLSCIMLLGLLMLFRRPSVVTWAKPRSVIVAVFLGIARLGRIVNKASLSRSVLLE